MEEDNMPQLAIYLDEKTAKKLDEVVQASGKSRSKWVADLIKSRLEDDWPEGFFDLAGAWEGSESPEEIMTSIREGVDLFEKREQIN